MRRVFKTYEALVGFTEEQRCAQGGAAFHVTILHDDACSPSSCVCSPEYVLEELTADTLLKGAEAQRRWKKETSS